MSEKLNSENSTLEIVQLPENENKALVLAATGSPYLLLVHQKNVGVHRVIKAGFDTDWLFDFIKDIAKENKEFRTVLADYIIELSQEL